jgi:hypothetical protein
MIEPKKRKAFSIQEKVGILALMDANKETRVALAARFGIAPSTLNTVVKSRKDAELLRTMWQWQVLWSKEEPETVTI